VNSRRFGGVTDVDEDHVDIRSFVEHTDDAPLSQAWFWMPEWQAREREADADFAAGRHRVFDDAASFLANLDA
jgi:hypothetical protein